MQYVLRASRAFSIERPLPDNIDDAPIRSRIYPSRDRSEST